MNQKALSTLEYTKIIAQLEEYASTSMGKKRCRELVPMNDLQEIKTAQAQTSDALARILRKGSISFSGAKGSKLFPNLQEGTIRLLSFPEVTITDNEWLVKCRFNDN